MTRALTRGPTAATGHTVQPQPDWSKLAAPKCVNGPCRQGRGVCRTPQACRLIASASQRARRTVEPAERVQRRFVIRLVLAIALIAAGGLYLGLQ